SLRRRPRRWRRGPAVPCDQRRPTAKRIRADRVHLKFERVAGDDVGGRARCLLHLEPANDRHLVRAEVVGAPVVAEAQRAIELRRTEAAVISDIQPRHVSRPGDRRVPAIAVVDDLCSRRSHRDALEVAPHHHTVRNPDAARFRRGNVAVRRALVDGRGPRAVRLDVLHDHQAQPRLDEPVRFGGAQVVVMNGLTTDVSHAEPIAALDERRCDIRLDDEIGVESAEPIGRREHVTVECHALLPECDHATRGIIRRQAMNAAGRRTSRLRIGIDTGGTFTDVVAVDEATGAIVTTKTPTTPHDPSLGVLEGIRKVLRLVDGGEVTAVSHGTTVATNALLAERFDGLALVTTSGFRHVLEIARQSVPQGYGNSYFWVKPDRIAPLHHVREVVERVDFRGRVLEPLDETAAAAVAAWLRRKKLTAIGISFIHAYANPAHERRMRE